MLRTMTLTVSPGQHRTEYLRRMLESLKKNPHLEKYELHCFVEPGNKESAQLCLNIDFMKRVVHQNPSVLGVRENPFNALRYVFNELCSDYNVYLEEDVILSPDALQLAEWFYENGTKENELCFNFLNYISNPQEPTKIYKWGFKSYNEIRNTKTESPFNALGFCLFVDAWKKYFERWWHTDPRGWDWSIREMLKSKPDLTLLCAAFSRSHHIGDYGTYCRPNIQRQLFKDHAYAQ